VTLVSGPHRVYNCASALRAIDESTVLVIASRCAPRARPSSIAAIVSAVSPDCDTAMIMVAVVDRRAPVSEFGRVIDLDRNPREMLDHKLAHLRGYPRRSRTQHHDSPRSMQVRPPASSSPSKRTVDEPPSARPAIVSIHACGWSLISLRR